MPRINCNKEEERTKGSFKDEVNINNIMARYNRTGKLPTIIKREPLYGDFSKSVDYQTAHEIVTKAEFQFRMLSAATRDRFGGSAVKFLRFCEDPANLEEMYALGLAIKPKEEKKPDENKEVQK
ncbi:MAG: internal scaffolding protein [Arizlama microvirus]|nr:MAG: internal scaffolding protein [Arizlama microvirus]